MIAGYFGVSEVAELFEVGKGMVRGWIRDGLLESVRRTRARRAQILISREALVCFKRRMRPRKDDKWLRREYIARTRGLDQSHRGD